MQYKNANIANFVYYGKTRLNSRSIWGKLDLSYKCETRSENFGTGVKHTSP